MRKMFVTASVMLFVFQAKEGSLLVLSQVRRRNSVYFVDLWTMALSA